MTHKRVFAILLVAVAATLSFVSIYWFAGQHSASDDATEQTSQRMEAKVHAVLAEVKEQAAVGNVREDVIAKMQEYQPLVHAGMLSDAEALLDEALDDLGVEFDPSQPPPNLGGLNGTRDDDLASQRQRLMRKGRLAVAEFQKRVESGDVPRDVADQLDRFGELMQEARYEQAAQRIDRALDALGIDSQTLQKTARGNQSPATHPAEPIVTGPLPAFNPDGFTQIFDGESLEDWDGDPAYWSVQDGKLVGTVTPETLLEKNSWILWRGGMVEDFELVLDYRVSAQGNSGVGYRLAVLEGDPYSVRGPQADIDGGNRFSGICYEENGRRLLAARGQVTRIEDSRTFPRLIAQLADPNELQQIVRKEDWNRYRLVVRGNEAKHFLNDFLFSEVHDFDDANRIQAGLIGVQVHVGPPMRIEYRNIFLKHLGEAPQGDALSDPPRHKPGVRLELEHSASFEQMVKQTAKLTAPIDEVRINDSDELKLSTRDLAIVRHDLQNVQLFGGPSPQPGNLASDLGLFDLVVSTPDSVIRIPHAGYRMIGRPPDLDYHVHLHWDATEKHYELIDLSPAEPPSTAEPTDTERSFKLGEPADLRQATGAQLPEWAADANTFIMLPVRPARARDLHVSVNGAWAGIPGHYSILPDNSEIQEEYNGDQAAFAAAVREAGMIVAASINTIEGFHTLRKSVPNLDEMACRSADGGLVTTDEMILMCSLNPDWVQWEIDTGKAAIDAGAEWILLDTPMGASFVSGFLKAGFCDHCMANFEKFLQEHHDASELACRFGIDDFDRSEIAQRLTAMQQVTPMNQSVHLKMSADALLFQEFTKCQEESNFASRKYLMETLYRYAEQQGKEVLFCTNAADLGTRNPGGHWIRGLQFSGLADLFTYELNNDHRGRLGAPQTKLPRGKWAAFHKLAYAVHHRRSPALIHTQDTSALREQARQGRSSRTWMAAQAVESYAANGAYIPFHIEFGSLDELAMEKIWKGVFEHNRFVQEHQDLYAGKLTSGSPVAILFLLNERGRTIPAVYPSYLGLAQGFIETNHPFDVVFAGDDRYVTDRLTPQDLESFQAIVVPSPIHPTPNQKQIVQEFVRAGGVVVCQEPERLGLVSEKAHPSPEQDAWWATEFRFGEGTVRVLAGDVTPTETHDVGTQFYRQYTPELRRKVARIAEFLGLQSIVAYPRDGRLTAFSVVQPERQRVLVHLVNYDVDYSQDAIRPKKNILVSILAPDFLPHSLSGTLYNCQTGMEVPITVERQDGRLAFTIPELELGSVVEIAASQAGAAPR